MGLVSRCRYTFLLLNYLQFQIVLASSGGFLGEIWKNELYYYPEVDQTPQTRHLIPQHDLLESFGNLTNMIEPISKAELYTAKDDSDLGLGISDHYFILLTTTDWYWSVEKLTYAILIQRSTDYSVLRDEYRGNKRRKPMMKCTGEPVNKMGKMGDVITDLYENEEVEKGYFVLGKNCQTFANRLFRSITGELCKSVGNRGVPMVAAAGVTPVIITVAFYFRQIG